MTIWFFGGLLIKANFLLNLLILCWSRTTILLHNGALFSKHIWRAFVLGINAEGVNHTPFWQWLQNYILLFSGDKAVDLDRNVELVLILWAIWIHRNEVVFKNQTPNPSRILELEEVFKRQHAKAAGFQRTYAHSHPPSSPTPPWFQKGSEPHSHPSEIWVDGDWKKRRKKGLCTDRGWVLKLAGQVIGKGSEVIMASSALQAKGYAIL